MRALMVAGPLKVKMALLAAPAVWAPEMTIDPAGAEGTSPGRSRRGAHRQRPGLRHIAEFHWLQPLPRLVRSPAE